MGKSKKEVKGLDIIPGHIKRFHFTETSKKVPHIAWNSLVKNSKRDFPLLNLKKKHYMYFIHSYYAPDTIPEKYIAAYCLYHDCRFVAMLSYKNLLATQFHPEKSGQVGLSLLQNWVHSLKK